MGQAEISRGYSSELRKWLREDCGHVKVLERGKKKVRLEGTWDKLFLPTFLDILRQPLQTLKQAFSGGGTTEQMRDTSA
jgi:hypothetical protein